jgi:two-component system KDP operon response regulator KdpE
MDQAIQKTDRKTILVIDDSPAIRQFLRIALSSHDFELIEAETGKDGLKSVEIGCPDLVILDLGLPDIDGHQVLDQMREKTDPECQLPVIILSVRSERKDIKQAKENGADAYITKPFRIDELISTVENLL